MAQRPLTAAAAQRDLAKIADPEVASIVRRFFRTGKGEYGEGDVFRGIKVPKIRAVARDYRDLPLAEIRKLLRSRFHEDRLLALIVLVHRADRASTDEGRNLAEFFLRERAGINNWDLIDTSAPAVLGPFVDELATTLDDMSRSTNVWDRRISILAHFRGIREGKTDRFYRFAPRFLDDEHDLIHKAVGWLLREAGKHDAARLAAFVQRHSARMPRTMLRYAIEKFSPEERRRLMA